MLSLRSACLCCSTPWPALGTGEAGRCQAGCSPKDGSSIAEVGKRAKLCTAQQPLAIYLLLQQQSQQILPVWGKLADHKPVRAAGNWDRAGQDQSLSFPTG